MFSDETRFSLQSVSQRTLIWKVPGTRYHQEITIERHRYGGAEWLVWGRIILGSRTDLHVQSVTITGHIYRDVILEQHVRLVRGTMGAESLFMDNNARFHRSNMVDDCPPSEDITRIDWAAYSPDLNPIDHVWDMLGRRIADRQLPPTCLPELRRALHDEWCNISQDQVDNFILSMPRRCKCLRVPFEAVYSRVVCPQAIHCLVYPLTQNHRRLRCQWCNERRMWVTEWNEVFFTDESSICLQHHDGRIRVWRHRGQRVLNSCVMHRHTGPASGIMGLATAIFQQDNARPHMTRIVQRLFVNHQIELLPCPARSLDLSPIENMWPMVAPRLTQITPPAATPDQLWQCVKAAWSAVPQEHIQSLFESMQRRVAEVISNNGSYSGY
ncbi:transposable element Tcb1 transposase [Trichonephila clavipes]|nr:transposable element Tcb1 transposase [Trichonephila clavipes]